MADPFFCHWYESGAVPSAETLKVTAAPILAVWFVGCCVIVGGAAVGVVGGTGVGVGEGLGVEPVGGVVELSPPDPPHAVNSKAHANPDASLLFMVFDTAPRAAPPSSRR